MKLLLQHSSYAPENQAQNFQKKSKHFMRKNFFVEKKQYECKIINFYIGLA